jgi:hypothetical protein
MISAKTFIDGWNRFFYSKTDASTLCLFRVFMGFFLFLNGISLVEDIEYWFGTGTNALVPLADSLSFYRGFRINLFKIMSPTETSAWIILMTYIAASFSVMIGYKTKIATVVSFILLVSLQNRNYVILNSGDTILRCMLFVLIFAPSNVKYSVDAWLAKKSGKISDSEIPILTIRLLQLQFSLVYLATTLFKLKGYDWVDGTAVYYTSRLVNFQRMPIPVIFDFVFLVQMATWSALVIEFAMGTLIWVKEFRKWVLLAGLILHLGIEVTMSIGFFEWVMISAYVLFLEPYEFRFFANWFRSLSMKRLHRA